jgi:pimeloyl-ACP methyl ester carboxylesterase
VAFQFVAYSIPGVGEAYLRALQRRATPREQVQGVIDLCFADPARADPAMVEATVALTELRQELSGRNAAFLEAARSLLRISGHARKYWETMAAIRVPVLLMGGTSDRLVPVASIRAVGRRNPGWQTEIFDGVGHTPQLETPGAVVTAVQGWLDQQLPPTQAQE